MATPESRPHRDTELRRNDVRGDAVGISAATTLAEITSADVDKKIKDAITMLESYGICFFHRFKQDRELALAISRRLAPRRGADVYVYRIDT